jgi:predicted TIM-barrel fold metal-dependent hydrolase
VLFGSDWPNSDGVASFDQVLNIAREYLAGKSAAAQQKYFWQNSVRAYKWIRRSSSQPMLQS